MVDFQNSSTLYPTFQVVKHCLEFQNKNSESESYAPNSSKVGLIWGWVGMGEPRHQYISKYFLKPSKFISQAVISHLDLEW